VTGLSDATWQALLDRRLEAVAAASDPLVPLYASLAVPPGERLVVAQVGQSLDGRIATASGDARDISGPDGLRHLHRLRALVDAVVIGAGTITHDDPHLTVRLVDGPNPARVLIDPNKRAADGANMFHDDGCRRLVFQTCRRSRPAGVEIVEVDGDNGVPPPAILDALAERGMTRVLVEGGANTIGRFLEEGLVDRLHVTVSSLLIGAGPSGVSLTPRDFLKDCLRPATRHYSLGDDVVFDCDLSSSA
jgi:diaminohydroxyphosphoribosylaminopyrimidine deaminase/5-amino-6-(5-phosphoribosylamino)uracil reductase